MTLYRFAAVVLCATAAFAQSGRSLKAGLVPGQIIVQERRDVDQVTVDRTVSQLGGQSRLRMHQTGHRVIKVNEAQVAAVMERLRQTGLFTVVEQDAWARSSGTPNDPNVGSQWHLNAVQAPDAWNTTTGGSGLIAIIDSGIDPNHPEFAGRLAQGWSYLTGTSDTHDVLGHGTWVAGTAAATGNNSIGVAGMVWKNPILPIVVLDSTDYATYSNIASGIMYAADRGARIINISIGGTQSSSTMQSAVDYAWNKGSVVFACAGNASSSEPYYPASCNRVVSVSATDSNRAMASFSSFGSTIDISAPGANILSTSNGGGYQYVAGTSFSSPITAAVGALVLSVNPSLSADALVKILTDSADDLGTPGYDIYFGAGQVNAAKAVALAAGAGVTPMTVSIAAPVAGSTLSGNSTVSGTVSGGQSLSRVDLYCDGQFIASGTASNFSFPWNASSVTAGPHTLKVTATSAAGTAVSASTPVYVAAAAQVGDTTAPVVTITSPMPNSALKGLVKIKGVSTDNAGVKQLCIYIDNVKVYDGVSAAFSYDWNTKKTPNGVHVIKVMAWDAAGNSGSAMVSIII